MEIISRKEAKEKGLKRYFTGKPCKHGHVAERGVSGGVCMACGRLRTSRYRKENKDKVKIYNDEYRKKNKHALKEKSKEYYNRNREEAIEKAKVYRTKNRELLREKDRKYKKENSQKVKRSRRESMRRARANNPEKYLERDRNYRKNNPDRLKEWRKRNPEQSFIRKSLERIFDNWKGGRKKMELAHGYTYDDLRHHIESQFKDGMSWENRSEWHIDHIKPIKAFLDEGVTDPKIINALDNLQPLWAHENLSKSAKYDG